MVVYADVVMLLNFLVDLFLLTGTNCLAGYRPGWKQSIPAAVVGGIYGGLCVIPELAFLSHNLWRLLSLAVLSVIAFGRDRSALRRSVLFILLSMALGGIAQGIGRGGFPALVCGAIMLFALCMIGFQGKAGQARYIAVKLVRQGSVYALTALLDTGNQLADPITGQRVLVVGSEVAWDVLGLTPQQLREPIATMQSGGVNGLRLIPYRAVGQPGGMLLAARMDEVWLDGKQVNNLVAFAPDRIGTDGSYQALTGGVI